MTRNELYLKVAKSDIRKIVESKGYKFFTNGDYNLNIIGVRADNNRRITNKYDDILVVMYKIRGEWKTIYYNITTEPGYYYMRKKKLSPKGSAILVPGQYLSSWAIGWHRKYKALVQMLPVKVYRDGNFDEYYDFDEKSIERGEFGINIHRSGETYTAKQIDKWSAGCQVFDNRYDFDSFMNLCNEAKERYGNRFTYTLIEEKDLDNE